MRRRYRRRDERLRSIGKRDEARRREDGESRGREREISRVPVSFDGKNIKISGNTMKDEKKKSNTKYVGIPRRRFAILSYAMNKSTIYRFERVKPSPRIG